MIKQRILVTGNLGYIGSAMVPMLTGAGYEVTGFDIGYFGTRDMVSMNQQSKKSHLKRCCFWQKENPSAIRRTAYGTKSWS